MRGLGFRARSWVRGGVRNRGHDHATALRLRRGVRGGGGDQGNGSGGRLRKRKPGYLLYGLISTAPEQKQTAGFSLCAFSEARGVRCRMERISDSLRPLSALLLALLFFPGCNALNLLCGSARPAPVIGSLSATTITFAEVQQGFLLTVNGSQFVSSSVVVINGTTLSTTVVSGQQLQVTITTALISGPGTASVTVNTPSGNSGDVGCTSGGTSSALVLTIT